MKLHTTINCFQDQDRIYSKIFNVQIIYKIDGIKSQLKKDIDIAEYFHKTNQIFTIKIINKPETIMKYRVFVHVKDEPEKKSYKINQREIKNSSPHKYQAKLKGQDQNHSKSIPKPILTNKSLKTIKFEDTFQNQGNQIKQKQSKSTKKIKIVEDQINYNFQEKRQQQYGTQQQGVSKGHLTKQIKNLQVKIQQLEKQVKERDKQLIKNQSKYKQIQSKYAQIGLKYKKLNQKYTEISTQRSIQNSKLKDQNNEVQQKMNQLKKQKQRYQLLEKQLKKLKQQGQKSLEYKQNQLKKSASQIKSLNEQIKRYQREIGSLKQQTKQFQQLLLQLQGKNKKGNSLEQSLKPYKQRIRILQKQTEDLQQEKNFVQSQATSKNQELYELKQRIKSFNQQNLKNLQEISNKNYEIQKLLKKVKDIEIELKTKQKQVAKGEDDQDQEDSNNMNKFKSQRIISGNSNSVSQLKAENSELKTKLSIALKNLQNKEALLKKFNDFSKEGKKEIEQEVQQLKKQNSHLKQKLSSFESSGSGKNNELFQLQTKMQLQKVKKQLEYKTKLERQLLIDKSQLQTRSKELQSDVIKSKQSIANILNVIHQFGNQELIEQVNSFLG